MDRLAALEAIEEIKRLKARYFYCLDHQDWEGWRDHVFCASASLFVPEANPEPFVGIDNILAMLKISLEGVKSIHHGHMPEIELTSETTAKGIWAMEDVLFFPARKSPTGRDVRVHGYGHYRETYERQANGWRIKTLHLTRLLNPAEILPSS